MTAAEADILIQQGEGLRVEFKEAQSGIPSDLYESVAAMANTDGGSIFLGVRNDGTVLGLSSAAIISFQTAIATVLNDPGCIHPPYLLNIIPVTHTHGTILLLQVPASSQVHDHAGRIYMRSGDADLDITENRSEVGDLYIRKRNVFSESQILPHLRYEDLNGDLFNKARQIIRSAKPSHPWGHATDDQILEGSLLYRKDYQTGQEGLTLAAALVFGKDTTISSLLPAYKVEALVRRENLDRYDDRLTLRTNLIDSYEALMAFIEKHLPRKFFIEDGQNKDLRELIFREVIGNLLVHREYNHPLSSELIIYKDRVVTTNPNKALFHGPLNLDRFSAYPKNPNIRRFFTAFSWTDELGSGVRNTRKYLAAYTPGMEPLFVENDIFRTEIPLLSATMGSYVQPWLQWLELSEEALPHLEEGFGALALDPAMAVTGWTDFLLAMVPWWNQKGTMVSSLDWPKNQIVTEEDLKKVPSWPQKGTMVLHKKVRYLLAILALAAQPVKLDQLLQWIGYSNRNTFRNNYLLPLQRVGFIAMTNPDKPKDPEQKYYLTEAGRLFLTGRTFGI